MLARTTQTESIRQSSQSEHVCYKKEANKLISELVVAVICVRALYDEDYQLSNHTSISGSQLM